MFFEILNHKQHKLSLFISLITLEKAIHLPILVA